MDKYSKIKISKIVVLSGLFALILASCNRLTSENPAPELDISVPGCDTLPLFVIDLIDKLDSITIYDKVKFERSFEYTFWDKNDSVQQRKLPFLDHFHLRVETDSVNQLYYGAFVLDSSHFNARDVGLNVNCLGDYLVISSDSVTKMRESFEAFELEGLYEYYSISYPVLSLDKQLIFVELDEHCYGLCGVGYSFVFRNSIDGWVLDRKWVRWVS